MTFTARPIQREADAPILLALADQTRAENLHATDLPWRLSSWALDDPDNGRLWLDRHGRPAAWALLNSPFWTLDFVLAADAEGLLPDLLAWAAARMGEIRESRYGHPCWFAMVFPRQAARCAALRAAGYADQSDVGEDSWSKTLLARACPQEMKAYPPPPGFTIRPLDPQTEIEAYVRLQREVFESENMTADWRRRSAALGHHQADLDLVAAAPDGRLAAFCVCWLQDSVNGRRYGAVEPLGCASAYRRYALGRSVLAEGLRRLEAAGAQTITVETDRQRNTALALYESLGFREIEPAAVYRLDL